MHVLQFPNVLQVKRKTQFANRCIAVKIALQNSLQRNSTSVDAINASLAKNIYPTTTNVSCSPHKFLDEIAYDNAGQDKDLIGKADALFKQRLQKSRYIVLDIETFALNQQSGKGRQVPTY